MKSIIFSIVFFIIGTLNLLGQHSIAGHEQFDCYNVIKYYDNLPEHLLPLSLLHYYENLTAVDIKEVEQVIDMTNKERQLHITTKAASRYYLSMTKDLWCNILSRQTMAGIEFIVNGDLLSTDTILPLLRMNRKNAKTVTSEIEAEQVFVYVIL